MRSLRKRFPIILAGLALAVVPAMPAAAYVGPGAGLSAIGTILAVVAALFLAIVGFVWYPVKRMLRHRKAGAQNAATDPADAGKASSQTGTEE